MRGLSTGLTIGAPIAFEESDTVFANERGGTEIVWRIRGRSSMNVEVGGRGGP